jgi:hypothetical protein
MNDRPSFGDTLLLMFCIVVVGFMTYFLGYTKGEHKIYLEAVKHDAAHWVAEPDGTAHIEWGKK